MPITTLAVTDEDRRMLESWTRSSTVSAGQRERAEVVLAIAGGDGVSGAARRLGVSRPTVIKWRDRFAADGIAGLGDRPRSGRPKMIDDAQIIAATLEPPPAKLAVTHWSSRLLGKHLGIGDATVARAWRAYRVQPWRQGTFKFSTDPELEAKVRDVIGLYLNPPQNAIVLCVDEKSQIQALNRTQPILPVRPGLPEKATHDYKRNGTTTLFAALEVATGTVTDRCYDRHGKAEFLDFLKLVAKAYPRRKLHVVLDNYHTHKHDDIYETTTGSIPAATGWLTFYFNQAPFVWNGSSPVQVITEIIRPASWTATGFSWRTITSLTNAAANANAASSAPPTTLSRTGTRPQVRFELVNTGVDAALLNLAGVSNASPGTQNLSVTLQNTGNTTLTAATINYSVNAGTPTSYAWTGSLAPGAFTTVSIGSVNLGLGSNTVSVSVVDANGAADVDASNNTLSRTVQICFPLSGTAYTINNNAPTGGNNFASFTEFADALANCGMSGPVTATVDASSGPYTEQVLFRTIAGLGASAPLIIEGNGRTITSDTAIIQNNSNPNRHIIRFEDLQYVTLNNLKVEMVAGSTGFLGIHVVGSGNRITVSNCSVDMGTSVSSLVAGITFNGNLASNISDGGDFDSLLITGNLTTGGGYGVTVFGLASRLATSVRISNNTFKDNNSNGIYLRETDSVQVANNIFDQNAGNAIQVAQTANVDARIYSNQIRMPQTASTGTIRGIYLFDGTGHRVFNNAIYNVDSNAGEIVGIQLRTSGTAPEVYFNTISMDQTDQSTGRMFGIRIESSAVGARIMNNLISITQPTTGFKSAYIFNVNNSGVNSIPQNLDTSDHNIFWVPGGSLVGLGSTSPTVYAADRSTWNGLTNQDVTSSDNINPQFASLTQPTPTNPAAYNTGVPIAGITTDINGTNRSATPDIGAIEDNVPLSASLTSFYGEHRAGTNRLYWATGSEWGNEGFELQRSADGKHFEKLAFIPSAASNGSSSRALQYTFDDVAPMDGKNHYRLRQMSISGSETFSNIVTLSSGRSASASPATLYPNPATQSLMVDFTVAKAGEVQLQITDVSGRLILTHTVQAAAGKNMAPIPVSGIPAGMYLLRIRCGEGCEAGSQPWQKR